MTEAIDCPQCKQTYLDERNLTFILDQTMCIDCYFDEYSQERAYSDYQEREIQALKEHQVL